MPDIPDPHIDPPALDRHTPLAYTRFEWVESAIFTKQVKGLLGDESYRELQNFVVLHPEAGDVIPGARGLRKLRWRTAGRGKRGGARVIYLLRYPTSRIYFVAIYAKSDGTEFSRAELRAMRDHILED